MGLKTNRTVIFLVILCVALAIVGAVAIYFAASRDGMCAVGNGKPTPTSTSPTTTPSSPPPSKKAAYPSIAKQYKYAGVASDNEICNKIGSRIMGALGGSAVDAAIATLFCLGVTRPQNSGLGGGNFMTVYDVPRGQSSKVLTTFTAREMAPQAAHTNMFVNKTGASRTGGLAIGVPGELAGYYAAWQRFGKVEWDELVLPSIRLCREGIIVNYLLLIDIKLKETLIRENPTLNATFVKPDGSLVEEGDILKQPLLGRTLERVAIDPLSFYNGSLAQDIVDDVNEFGGIFTLDDLSGYFVEEKLPISVHLNNGNFTVYSPRPPSSGAVLQLILNILDELDLTPTHAETSNIVSTYHLMIEAFKFAFGQRSALGDEDFVDLEQNINELTSEDLAKEVAAKINNTHTQELPYYGAKFQIVEDHGTGHISVLAPGGSAVSVTTSINTQFGSCVKGSKTGITFNNEMDDFSTPGTVNVYGVAASPSNFIMPGKRPMSSMSPSLVLDQNGEVALAIGASGGPLIITGIAHVTVYNLWLGKNLLEAMDMPRFHHQLLPPTLFIERGFTQEVLDELKSFGHETQLKEDLFSKVEPVRQHCNDCMGNSCLDTLCVTAAGDGRRFTIPSGF